MVVLCSGEIVEQYSDGAVLDNVLDEVTIENSTVDRKGLSYLSNDKVMSVHWTSKDVIGAPLRFQIGAGRVMGQDDLIKFREGVTGSCILSVPEGEALNGTVLVTVNAYDSDFSDSPVSSKSLAIVIDVTNPLPSYIHHVSDGEPACQVSASDLRAYFEPFTDPESPIDRYEYAIVTAEQQRGLKEAEVFIDLGESTNIHATGLNLQQGSTITLFVRGWNAAGLFALASITGITPITSSPSIEPIVATLNSDGIVSRAIVRGSYLRPSVICGLGHTPFAPDFALVPPASVTELVEEGSHGAYQVECRFFDLPFWSGTRYFSILKASLCGAAFSTSEASSGLVYETKTFLPVSGLFSAGSVYACKPLDNVVYTSRIAPIHVYRNDDTDESNGTASYSLWIVHSGLQQECRLCRENCTAGSAQDRLDLGTFTSSSRGNITVDISQYEPLSDRCSYTLALDFLDAAGLVLQSNFKMFVDNTPPIVGAVEIVANGKSSEQKCSGRRSVFFQWGGFHDDESGICLYEWAAGTALFASDLVDFRPSDSLFHWAQVDLDIEHHNSSQLASSTLRIFITVRVSVPTGYESDVLGHLKSVSRFQRCGIKTRCSR